VSGSLVVILFASFVARFRSVGAALMPFAIAANAVPIIAFAPIFNAWFNPLSPHSKSAIAAVLCFFPVMVNTLRGLTSVRAAQVQLMKSYAASDLEIFRRVRIPTALPYVFAALKVASVLAMIGAVVGEYFGGSFNALGVLIRSDAQILDFDRLGRDRDRVGARSRSTSHCDRRALPRPLVAWARASDKPGYR
jgi:NitT/TauT family transport system permease protein